MVVKLSPREKAALATQAMNKGSTPSPAVTVDVAPRLSNSVQIGLSMAGQGGRVKDLEKELDEVSSAFKNLNAEWQGVLPSKKLDPAMVKPSRWANRAAHSFEVKDFANLKAEIESAGGNVQPIKVRPIPGSSPQAYEIVFGHRRHRACLELGLDVLAVIESIDDKALFREMDRENRQRADLRPYEQGVMYKRAVDEKMFTNVNQLAVELGVDVSNVRKAIALAELPVEVLDAFESRLDIQFAWAKKIRDVLAKDERAVLQRARAVLKERTEGRAVVSSEVLSRILGVVAAASSGPRKVQVGAQAFTVSVVGERVSFEVDGLNADKLQRIEKFIKDLLVA